MHGIPTSTCGARWWAARIAPGKAAHVVGGTAPVPGPSRRLCSSNVRAPATRSILRTRRRPCTVTEPGLGPSLPLCTPQAPPPTVNRPSTRPAHPQGALAQTQALSASAKGGGKPELAPGFPPDRLTAGGRSRKGVWGVPVPTPPRPEGLPRRQSESWAAWACCPLPWPCRSPACVAAGCCRRLTCCAWTLLPAMAG